MIKDIVYATDNLYAPLLCVSLVSLFENNKDIKFDVYVLDNNISVHNKDKIMAIAKKYKSNCFFICINDYSSLSSKGLEVHKLSLSTYSRLLIPNVLPEDIEYVLYVDCDTIINGSLRELLNINIENYGIAGVEDAINPKEKEGIGLSKNIRYINAGVLLINVKYWRTHKLFNKYIKFIDKYKGKVPYLDQGIINGTISERLILPLKYNVQSPIFAIHSYKRLLRYFNLEVYYTESEIAECRKRPIIIHFTSFYMGRPWIRGCRHPYKEVYNKYLKLSNVNIEKWDCNDSIISRVKNYIFIYAQFLYFILKGLR